MSEHRWAVVPVVVLDEDQAAALAGDVLATDPARLCEVMAAGIVETVGGPLCVDCRVSWADVHAEAGRPWPCPGRRPKELGGPLIVDEDRRSRQVRRAARRDALRHAATGGATPFGGGAPNAYGNAVAAAHERSERERRARIAEPESIALADPRPCLPDRVRL